MSGEGTRESKSVDDLQRWVHQIPISKSSSLERTSVINPHYHSYDYIQNAIPVSIDQEEDEMDDISPDGYFSPNRINEERFHSAEEDEGWNAFQRGNWISATSEPIAPAIVPVSSTSVSQTSISTVVQLKSETPNPRDDDVDSDTESSPLLKISPTVIPEKKKSFNYKHTRLYELITTIPCAGCRYPEGHNQIKIGGVRDEEDEWWCWRTEFHPMASVFTNEEHRRDFATQILKWKIIHLLPCLIVSIIIQLFWTWEENKKNGTPAYILFIEEHRWILVLPMTTYYGLLFFIRIYHYYGRVPPLNYLFIGLLTLLLVFSITILSVGYVDIFPSECVPIILGALILSYVIFQRFLHLKHGKLQAIPESSTIYWYVPPVIISGIGVTAPFVIGLLIWNDSVVILSRAFRECLVFDGFLCLLIGGTILGLEIHRIRLILQGHRLSILSQDMSEALFASFYT